MLTLIERAAMTGAVLLVAGQAVAQSGQPLTVEPEGFPRWDAGGGVGLFYMRPLDDREFDDYWDVHGDVRVDVGRYWTTHLKTEIGLSLPQTWTDYRYDPFPVTGPASGANSFTEVKRRLTTFSPSVTYQFLENTFAHPYLSAGVRMGVLETHERREERTATQNQITVTVPALDERSTSVRAAPFVAGGFKSYFNDRAFVRSEALVAFRSGAAEQLTFRLAFGLDF